MCRAAAPSRLLIRPATAAVTSPARGSSFRLIVKVSMGGRHFHGAVTPRHFYVAVAVRDCALDARRAGADSDATLKPRGGRHGGAQDRPARRDRDREVRP